MNRLHVLARLLRCKALAWECVQVAAARIEVAAWEKSHEALRCSELVERRAEEAADV